MAQVGAGVAGLAIGVGHFKNWKQLDVIIEQMEDWDKDIDAALNVIKAFQLNKFNMTDEMEKELIGLQVREDERLAKIWHKQEKARVKQIEEDRKLAQKVSQQIE